MKVRLALITCGTCGRPRGLRHTCVPRADSRRRKRRTSVKPKITATCGRCGKPRGARHTCAIRTDFKKRRKQAGRQARTAERKRRSTEAKQRRAAAARERKAAAKARPKRPRPPAHDYRACFDPECERYPCRVYREGIEDCPRPHGDN